jgi:hypothetical protein
MRHFIAQDHKTVATWWEGHGWQAIPLDALPARGLIVPELAAGFLYQTDSNIGIMEWIVSNPQATPRKAYEAIQDIVSGLHMMAKDMGCKSILTFARHRGLIRLYEKSGFVKTDENMTHMIMGVN